MSQQKREPPTQNVFNASNADATFVHNHKDAKIFENHLNPVMLVFIG